MRHEEYIRAVPGSRTAVLLIHGIVGTPYHFRELVPVIPEDLSIYNILLDGHGRQVQDFAATSMEKWKAQVDRQLETILSQHERVVIVAHSMGSLFALQAAVRDGSRIAGLFLLGVPLTPHVPPSTAVNACRAALGLAKPDTPAQAILDDCGVELSPQLWRYLTWLPRFWELFAQIHATRKILPRLTVPCRTYQSRRDELVSIRACKYLDAHPSITNTVLPTSGHFAYSEEDMRLLQADLTAMLTQL